MHPILVLATLRDGDPDTDTRGLLAVAASLGEAHAVVIVDEADADRVTIQLGVAGASVVHAVSIDSDSAIVTPEVAALSAAIDSMSELDAVLLPPTTLGNEVAARLAVRIGGSYFSAAQGLSRASDDRIEIEQSALGGGFTVRAASSGPIPVIVVRALASAEPAAQSPQLVRLTAVDTAARSVGTLVESTSTSTRPPLSSATVVVAGGMGVGSREGFEIVTQLADELEAGVGASRAAVDAGYAEHDAQVGQTGITVSPELYVAVGISGAIQHLAGMRTASTIIAINQDRSAPIFDVADFGVVGDVHTVVPALIAALREERARP